MKKQPTTSIGSQELSRYVDNDQRFYKVKLAVARVLAARKARGNYHPFIAEKSFRLQLAKPAAQAYCREFGHGQKEWRTCFTSHDLRDFGRHYMKWFEAEYKLGNFESLLPPKLQSRKTREKTEAAMRVADKQRNHSIGEHYGEEGKRPAKQQHWENNRAKAWWKKHPHHDDNVCSWKAGHTGQCDAWPGKGSKPKRGASRGGRVPSGAVKPHKSKRACQQCGRIHAKRVHWSHGAAPKGGKAGGYKKKRAGK